MKWILLIIPLIMKQFAHFSGEGSHPLKELKELIRANSFKIFFGITGAYFLATLFASGLILLILNLTIQYDSGLNPSLTAVAAGGLGMMLAALIILAIVFYYASSSKMPQKPAISQSFGHPLEEALVILINDFVEERAHKRAQYKQKKEQDKEQNKEADNSNIASRDLFERH
jgi:hypothetical protein